VDFSLLTAIAHTHPHAITLRDLGVTETSSSDLTQAMLSLLNQYRAGTPFKSQDVEEESIKITAMLGAKPRSSTLNCRTRGILLVRDLKDTHDHLRIQNIDGQTLAHNNPMHEEWRKSEKLEMDGLWKWKCIETSQTFLTVTTR